MAMALASAPDPDRDRALPFLLLEDDHRLVGRAIESQMRDPNLNLVRAFKVPSPTMSDTSAARA